MPTDNKPNFSSQFREGWEATWLSVGKWLGGCAPVLVILGLLFGLFVLFVILAAASNR